MKPGGVLGIEEHRGQRDTAQDPKAEDGYVRQDYAIALAEKAGFKFEGSSEIGANLEGHRELAEGRVDFASNAEARRPGQSQVRGDRRSGQFCAQISQANAMISARYAAALPAAVAVFTSLRRPVRTS